MRGIFGWTVGFFAVIAAVFLLLFLGGLASAWFEVRAEKKSGVPVTRPAWDNRDKRRARGVSLFQSVRESWEQARGRSIGSGCWCGRGPITEFPEDFGGFPAGLGCAAWEAGDPEAVVRHDRAGGYQRTPVKVAS